MKLYAISFLMAFSLQILAGCSATAPLVAYDFGSNECYHGSVWMSLIDGTGTVQATADRSGTLARGVAMYSFGSGERRGGTATIQVEDGRLVKAEWVSTGLTSGTGTGHDQFGNSFRFIFGTTPDEESQFIHRQRRLVIQIWRSHDPTGVMSNAEREYRAWNFAVGYQSRLIFQTERNPLTTSAKAFSMAEPQERKLRDAMLAEGFESVIIDEMLAQEKAAWPEDLQALMQRKGLIAN